MAYEEMRETLNQVQGDVRMVQGSLLFANSVPKVSPTFYEQITRNNALSNWK